jgi:TonB family protein
VRRFLLGLAALTGAACGGGADSGDLASDTTTPPFEPPVAVNAEPPLSYPTDLFEEGVEGTVVLMLFVDETGALVPDSTRIADSSGYPALDSAVLAGVGELEYAPARRDGAPVATWFLQPVQFRQPERAGTGGGL